MEEARADETEQVEIRFLGHNCFVIDDGETCVVTDPWFSTSGAFLGSWFQYPPNQHLADRVRELLADRDGLVYVSHEHSDHFDEEFLSQLPTGTPVCTARYDDRFLADRMVSMGLSVIEVEDGRSISHGSAQVTIFKVESGIARDSAALIEMGDVRFLDQNDCKMFDRLDVIPRPVTHYAVQFSGASWYPACYELPSAEKARRARDLTANKVRNVSSALRALEPLVYLPSAGPVAFPFLPADFDADPAATTFVHQTLLAEQLDVPASTRVAYLRPGETLSDDVGREPIPPPSRAEIDAYAGGLVDRWSSFEDTLDRQLLLREVEARLALLADHYLGEPPLIEFVWGEERSDRLLIDLVGGRASLGESAPTDTSVTVIRASERYFQLLATVDRWQEVVHSFRARVTRRPDVFSNAVNLFLYSDKQTLSNSLAGAASDRFEVTSDGRRFELDRRCPHQGADLSHGSLEDGCVVCPRHGWRFDLSDGGRDSRSGTTVNAVEIAPSRLA